MSSNKNPMGRPLDWTGAWRDMVDAAGGVVTLAEMLHVSRRTLERLKDRPIDIVPFRDKLLVNQIAGKLGVRSPFIPERQSTTIRAAKRTA